MAKRKEIDHEEMKRSEEPESSEEESSGDDVGQAPHPPVPL